MGQRCRLPPENGTCLSFLPCHVLWPLGKIPFSSFGDFSLKMKLLERGFASPCCDKTKLNQFPQLPAVIQPGTTDSSNKIFVHVPPKQMLHGTFWQQNRTSRLLLGAKAEHVTHTFSQTSQLSNYSFKDLPTVLNLVIML